MNFLCLPSPIFFESHLGSKKNQCFIQNSVVTGGVVSRFQYTSKCLSWKALLIPSVPGGHLDSHYLVSRRCVTKFLSDGGFHHWSLGENNSTLFSADVSTRPSQASDYLLMVTGQPLAQSQPREKC